MAHQIVPDSFPVHPNAAEADTPPGLPRGTAARAGKIRPMVLIWALGVPIPIVLMIFLIRACTG